MEDSAIRTEFFAQTEIDGAVVTRSARARRGYYVWIALVLFAFPQPAEAKDRSDWSKVQTVPVATKTTVVLYKDEAPRGSRKIKGHFGSATAQTVTVLLPNEQSRTLARKVVRQVLISRPFRDRYAGWLVLGGGVALVEGFGANFFLNDFSFLGRLVYVYLPIVAPLTAVTFYGLRHRLVYDLPPEQRGP